MEIAKKNHKPQIKNKNINKEAIVPKWFNNQPTSITEASVDEQKEMEDFLKEFE